MSAQERVRNDFGVGVVPDDVTFIVISEGDGAAGKAAVGRNGFGGKRSVELDELAMMLGIALLTSSEGGKKESQGDD